MTDRYENIRKALAMGPTPGPWVVRYDYVVQARSYEDGRLVPVAQPYGVNCDGTDLFANARLIAARDPDTIRELLNERDALAAENAGLRREAHPAITHCDNCGCDWLDNGLNPVGCPYCKQSEAVDEAMVERIAALLYEEATDEPWTVAGVEHPGPDRSYYRRLASKVAALAALVDPTRLMQCVQREEALLRQALDAIAYWLEHGETPGSHDIIQRTHDALQERLKWPAAPSPSASAPRPA